MQQNEVKKKKKSKFNFIEVCAGAGGLSTGLMMAGFIPLLLNDINKDCCCEANEKD